MREERREDHGLAQAEETAVLAPFCDFQHDGDVRAVERQTLLDCLLDGILLGSLEVLEPPDPRVFLWQVLEGVPIAVLEALDASILLKPHSCALQWRVHLVGEVHILLGTRL